MPGEAALAFLLRTLEEQLRNYRDLKDGEEQELQALQSELRRLLAFLENAWTVRHEKNEMFKEFESLIREVVRDAEDTVDSCLAKSAAVKSRSLLGRSTSYFSVNMANQVRLLRQQKVTPIVQRIQNEYPARDVFSPRKHEIKREPGQPSQVYIHKKNEYTYHHEKIVSFDGEAEVVGCLMGSSKGLDVISITGLPGLGKSTFAQKIFAHEVIVEDFPDRIWISVPQMSNREDVFRKILKHFTPRRSTSRQSGDDIEHAVRACLSNKRWLLVMDNVSTAKEWEDVKKILPMDNSQAKVLLTTREMEIAAGATVYTKPHQLKKLGQKESLELLKLLTFNNPENFPSQLEDIGQAIADKCDGVPLAILVIGGYLKEFFIKETSITAVMEEWERVAETVGDILRKDKRKLISGALEWSYNSLAHDLRVCLLYTGLFPENKEILASALTKLWISEGFIRCADDDDKISLEEAANKVLDELVSRNWISVARKNLERVKTCRVHDMIRAFCMTKATEENFYRVVKASEEGALEPPVSKVQEFRRVCLQANPSGFLSGNPRGPHVRSFLCFFDETLDLHPTHTSVIPDAFTVLRVLSCESIKFGKFPEVTKLILLKHIKLCIQNLTALPKEISKLLSLQTLIVDTNSHSITVEANISKMVQLRRLKTKSAISLDSKNWKGRASENLQTLSRLSPKSCTTALSAERAPDLKTLGIRGKVANLFETFTLDKFRHLQNLKIVNDLGHESASANPLICLPQPGRFSPNIVRLTLSKTFLKWGSHMPTLAQINTLKFLKLKDNAFTGPFWDPGESSGFPKLKFMLIQNSPLVRWNASTAYFPSLRHLVIKKCIQLLKIPESLTEKLEKLEIEGVKKSAADSARKIKSKKKLAQEKHEREWLFVPFNLAEGPDCDL